MTAPGRGQSIGMSGGLYLAGEKHEEGARWLRLHMSTADSVIIMCLVVGHTEALICIFICRNSCRYSIVGLKRKMWDRMGEALIL